MWQTSRGNRFISWIGLFSSFGTLLCCALPSLIVLLGFGATLASVLGNFPQLIWLSEHKGAVFGLSFLMLGISYAVQKSSEKKICAVDRSETCKDTKLWTEKLFMASLAINILGSFFAFVLPWLL